MDEDEMILRGKEVFEECYRGVVPMPAVSPKEFSGMTMKMFNDFWGDGRLSFREKGSSGFSGERVIRSWGG
jgi:hypothetical protein